MTEKSPAEFNELLTRARTFHSKRNYKEAVILDQQNGNTLWQEAVAKEMKQIKDYQTFRDLGKGIKPPPGHKKIYVHLVFANKFDMRRKARLVASGNLTPPTNDNACNGIVSLDSVRTIFTIAELNGLDLCAADIGNAYLEAQTREKLFIIAGPELERVKN